MRTPIIIAAVLLSLLSPTPASAQGEGEGDEEHDPWSWLVLPGAFRLPETGFGGGLILGLYYQPAPGRKTSSLPLTLAYTQNRQSSVQFSPELYLADDLVQIRGSLSAAEWPETYFGIGNRTPKSARELYTPQSVSARFVVQLQVSEWMYIGPSIYFVANRIEKLETGGTLDRDQPEGIDPYVVGGGGLSLTVDTRDSTIRSISGQLLRFEWNVAGEGRGQRRLFGRGEIDYRQFHPIAPGHTLALQGWFEFAHGDVPFNQMPIMGNDSRMRSYIAGRYRDNLFAGTQVEYRFPIWWRFTGTVFAGAGEVFDDLDGFSFRRLRWTAGGGPRMRLNDAGVTLRFDAAAGAEGLDFYFIVNEAF